MISTKISHRAILKTELVDDLHKYQVLPVPSGSYPYRLQLENGCNDLATGMMTFHMVGDTGGTGSAMQQQRTGSLMAAQFHAADTPGERPAFLYHLGDIVYHFGEASGYAKQFLLPFDCYPAPIYAIAGNHDTDVNPESEDNYECLDAFYNVFCNTSPKTIHFGGNSIRKSQVQPHVYWTMEFPLAVIIGLHTNVPKYGYVNREQRNWFVNELVNAGSKHPDKALIVCMHHAPYSADVNHGSSRTMIGLLEDAFEESGVKPDIVFSGHVHNYQRFTKQYADGRIVPYVVAGAGGFEELHPLADPADQAFDGRHECFEHVRLENYCDNRHGFLKISIEKSPLSFMLRGTYYTVPADDLIGEATAFDHFSIDLTGR